MQSRYQQLQDPGQRRHFALFRSSGAAAVVAALFAGAVLLPGAQSPVADRGDEWAAAFAAVVPADEERPPSHVFESAGTDLQDPHQYVGQPVVF